MATAPVFLHADNPWNILGADHEEMLRWHVLHAVSRGISYGALAEHLGIAVSEIGLLLRELRNQGKIKLRNGHAVLASKTNRNHIGTPWAQTVYDRVTPHISPLHFRIDDIRRTSGSEEDSLETWVEIRYAERPLRSTLSQWRRLGADPGSIEKTVDLAIRAFQKAGLHWSDASLGIHGCEAPPAPPSWVAPDGCLQACDA